VRSRLVVVAAGAAFVLLTLAGVGHFGPLFRFDAAASASAHRATLAHPAWRSALAAITRTGSTTVLGPIAAIGCLLLLLWRGRWRHAVFVAVGTLLTLGLRLLIVVSVARPRPPDRLAAAAGWSFPSGHTAASATAGLIAILVCRPVLHRRWSRALPCVVVEGWAVVVGYSRGWSGRALAQRRRRFLAAGRGGGAVDRSPAPGAAAGTGARARRGQRGLITAPTRLTGSASALIASDSSRTCGFVSAV
jgi:undecaprenyl-diphosphatase